MADFLICTPVHRVIDYYANEIRDVRPNETSWINMDQVVYATADQWIVKHPGEEDQAWDIVQIVMVDGTHFNILKNDWGGLPS